MSFVLDLLRNLFRKPATVLFPAEKLPVPECFRGRIRITDEKCIGCSRCAAVCPAQCITRVPDQKEVEVKGKKITRKRRPASMCSSASAVVSARTSARRTLST